MTKFLMDTGPLVAFFNAQDELHGWASEVFATIYGKVYTTESVLTETAYFLRKYLGHASPLLDKVSQGFFDLDFRLEPAAGKMNILMKRYAPKMDLADASLVILAEQLYSRDAIKLVTIDRDFQVYRVFGRMAIPIVSPPV